jgi:hypothetical protein
LKAIRHIEFSGQPCLEHVGLLAGTAMFHLELPLRMSTRGLFEIRLAKKVVADLRAAWKTHARWMAFAGSHPFGLMNQQTTTHSLMGAGLIA